MQKRLTIPLLLSCILGLTACGGGGGSNNSDTGSNNNKEGGDTNPAEIASYKEIILSPSLGKIIDGRAVLKNALTGQAITDIQNINVDGTVIFKVDSNKLKDPIIAEVLPNPAGKLIYADEAITDKLVTISTAPNTPVLRVATTITANKTNLGITALTEAAVAYAESQRFSVDSINAANKMVQTQLNLMKFNITDAPAIIGLNDFTPFANVSLNEQQRAYAAYLATLAREIKRLHPDSTQPAYEVAQALKQDLSDGVFDAKNGVYDNTYHVYHGYWAKAWLNWDEYFYDTVTKLKNTTETTQWFETFDTNSLYQSKNSQFCTEKSLSAAKLSDLVAYTGSYKNSSGMNILNLDITSGTAIVEGMPKSILYVCSNVKAINDKENNNTDFYVVIDYGTLNLSTFNTKNGNTQSVLYSVQTGTGTGLERSASRIIDSKPEPNPEPKPNPKPEPKPNPEPEPKPNPEPSCEAGQWGCVTITNFGKFTHSVTSRVLPQVPKVGTLTKDTLSVYFIRENDPDIVMQDSLIVSISKVLNSTSTYISFDGFAGLGDYQSYACGNTVNSNRIDCSGVTFNSVNRTVTFNNTKLAQVIDGTKIVTVNGTLKF